MFWPVRLSGARGKAQPVPQPVPRGLAEPVPRGPGAPPVSLGSGSLPISKGPGSLLHRRSLGVRHSADLKRPGLIRS